MVAGIGLVFVRLFKASKVVALWEVIYKRSGQVVCWFVSRNGDMNNNITKNHLQADLKIELETNALLLTVTMIWSVTYVSLVTVIEWTQS